MKSPACLVGRLQFLVLPPPVAHAELVNAEVSACGAVAMLYSVFNSFQLGSGCVSCLLPYGEVATSTQQSDEKFLKTAESELSTTNETDCLLFQ